MRTARRSRTIHLNNLASLFVIILYIIIIIIVVANIGVGARLGVSGMCRNLVAFTFASDPKRKTVTREKA